MPAVPALPAAELPACVFCGQPMRPEQETAGRAPMAAHASCADAALADDAHWDAISQADGRESLNEDRSNGEVPDGGSSSAATRSGGCLALALGLTVILALPLLLLIPG